MIKKKIHRVFLIPDKTQKEIFNVCLEQLQAHLQKAFMSKSIASTIRYESLVSEASIELSHSLFSANIQCRDGLVELQGVIYLLGLPLEQVMLRSMEDFMENIKAAYDRKP